MSLVDLVHHHHIVTLQDRVTDHLPEEKTFRQEEDPCCRGLTGLKSDLKRRKRERGRDKEGKRGRKGEGERKREGGREGLRKREREREREREILKAKYIQYT